MDHFYKSIPGWASFTRLYQDMVRDAREGDRFVEVGSWLGKSACFMAVEIINSGKDIRFDCVDPWTDGGPDLRNTKYFKSLGSPVYEQFLENTRPVQGRIRAMRMPSVEAARFYQDHSLDFIMLDGDHSYEAVRADLEAWLPKMKRGSIVSGDDWFWPGVKRATEERFGSRIQVTWTKRHPDYLKSASHWTVLV